jgi:phage terminase large subunit-like protein
MAGNQLGKTLGGSADAAYHLTGRYPEWWTGRRFTRPITMIAGSESYELTRDGLQRLLIGPPAAEEDWGTGMIPAAAILATTRRAGVSNAIDSATIRHASGGASSLLFKAYDQGRSKWQANTVDYVLFDEEPPEDVYLEGITRTNATGGIIRLMFTPLKGMSRVVARYLRESSPDRRVVNMTIYDAEHYTDEERQKIIDSYPPHEREARTKGVPSLGVGAIYPVPDEDILCDPFPIPDYWPRAYAMDVGWNKTAVIWGALDRSTDVLYLYSEHYRGQAEPAIHASAVKARGAWIPGVIDPASRGRAQKDGEQLIEAYRLLGLDIEPANNAVEAGLYECWTGLSTGRIKVFKTLANWIDEKRLYHRDENGKVVKEYDHLMDAFRYLRMSGMKRAKVKPADASALARAIPLDERAGY